MGRFRIILSKLLLLVFLITAQSAMASEAPPLGKYQGQGRACFGALYLRQKTIEWNATYTQCGPSAYTSIDLGKTKEGKTRYGFKLTNPGPKCRTPVIEMALYSEQAEYMNWAVTGYPSEKDALNPDLASETSYECGLTYDR